MLWTDWLRLLSALTLTGLSLYYNQYLTNKAADLLNVARFSYLYEVIQWLFILVSLFFLGIATNRRHVLRAVYVGIIMAGVYFLQKVIING